MTQPEYFLLLSSQDRRFPCPSTDQPRTVQRRPSSENPRSSRTPRVERHHRVARAEGRGDRAAGASRRRTDRCPDEAATTPRRARTSRRSSTSIARPRPAASPTTPTYLAASIARLRALGGRTASACPTSSTRSSRSSRSSTGSTASATSWCSRCTRRTARRTASSRRCSSRSIWPEFIAQLETEYTNKLFVSLRLVDFTPGYDTNSRRAVPRDRRDARDPAVHVGRDLPGPRGRALPPGRAGGIRDHQARPARRRRADARRPGSSPRRRS